MNDLNQFSTTLPLWAARETQRQTRPTGRAHNRQLPKASAASAVGALFPEDRHVGRHGGRLPLEQVAIPGLVARGGAALGGGRLEQPRHWLEDALPGLSLWE